MHIHLVSAIKTTPYRPWCTVEVSDNIFSDTQLDWTFSSYEGRERVQSHVFPDITSARWGTYRICAFLQRKGFIITHTPPRDEVRFLVPSACYPHLYTDVRRFFSGERKLAGLAERASQRDVVTLAALLSQPMYKVATMLWPTRDQLENFHDSTIDISGAFQNYLIRYRLRYPAAFSQRKLDMIDERRNFRSMSR